MSSVDTQTVPAGTWQVDKVHSSIGFAVKYIAGTFNGTFSDFDADLTNGVLNGAAKVASIQVKDENLAAHLRSPDFFDAPAHPELTFTSRAIERDGDRITIDARVTEGEVAVGHAGERFDENGRLSEPNLEQEVREVVTTLLDDAQSATTSRPSATAATS